MAITKEVVLDRIEIVYRMEDDGNRYPHIQARGKVEVLEDGVSLGTLGSFRFNAKAPDQDAGDQPDAPMGKEKIPVPQDIKDTLRATQAAHVPPAVKAAYEKLKADKEKEPITAEK
jgi:hypothetical protein